MTEQEKRIRLLERALVDGSFWGEYRMCLPCLDRYIDGKY